jgi:hypothetical protein
MIIGVIDENKLLTILNKLEKDFGREINYILLSERELIKRMKNDSFIKAVIEGPKINLL